MWINSTLVPRCAQLWSRLYIKKRSQNISKTSFSLLQLCMFRLIVTKKLAKTVASSSISLLDRECDSYLFLLLERCFVCCTQILVPNLPLNHYQFENSLRFAFIILIYTYVIYVCLFVRPLPHTQTDIMLPKASINRVIYKFQFKLI